MTTKTRLTFALDRISQAIETRAAELQIQLDRKDATASYPTNHGYAFLIRGAERVALERELDHLRRLAHYITEATA